MIFEEREVMDKACSVDKVGEGLKAFQECRWQEAVQLLDELFTENPSNIDIAGKLGFALSQARELDRAIEIFKHVSTIQPNRAIWPYMIGYQFYIKGEWAQSIEWFDKALNLNSDYIKVLYRKGYAQLRLGQREDALQTLRHSIEVWEQLPPAEQQANRKYYAKAHFQLGKAYLDVGLSLKARRPLEVAVSFDGDDLDKRYELGKCLLQNGDADGAIEQLSKANSLKAGVDYVLDRLAQALIAKGTLTKAEETYKMIPEHQRRAFVLKNMGALYLDLGQPNKALPILKQAVKKEQNSHNAHYLLGRALEAMGHKEAARQAYSKALNLKQRHYGRDFPDAQARITQLDLELPSITMVPDTTITDRDEQGIIDYYNAQRGFGFIMSNSGKKVFFHISSVVGEVTPFEGSSVIFQYQDSEKGLKATKIDLVSPQETS